MAGIRDVARRAGVSATTVSRVLNNDTTLSVGNKTKEKIYQAVQELNYDISKRKYVKKRYPSIGVIATISRQSEIDDPYFSDLRSGNGRRSEKITFGHESRL